MKKIFLLMILFATPPAMAETLSETVGTCEGFLLVAEKSSPGSTQIARKELQGFVLLNKKSIFIEPIISAMTDYVNAGRTLHEAMVLSDQRNPENKNLPYPPFERFLQKGQRACASLGVTTFLLEGDQ